MRLGSIKFNGRMLYWLSITIASTIFLMLSNKTKAEPVGLINKLITSEVSMLSFGLYRLTNELRYLHSKDDERPIVSARFDYETSTIHISTLYSFAKCESNKSCEEYARLQLERLSRRVCIKIRREDTGCQFDMIADSFSPDGYEIKSFHQGQSSTEALKNLRSHTELKVSVVGKKANSIDCKMQAVARDVYCRSE